MRKFNIISKYEENSKLLAEKIKTSLLENNFVYDERNPDLVIILGGDGKLLRTIHNYIDSIDKIDFVTFTTGTLGFSSDFIQTEIDEFIDLLIADEYTIEEIHLLEADINYYYKKEKKYALNELRLENRHHTCIIDVYLNDQHLENFRGNGLCVSTPFGSTGYNKSLSGAVVLNNVEVLQLTEVAGIHNINYRSLGNSLIFNKDTKISLKPTSKHTLIGIDHFLVDSNDLRSVDIRYSDKYIRFAHYKKKNCIDRIKKSFIYGKKEAK